MNCKDFEKLLSDYFENSITPTDKLKIEKHLEECSKCRELLNSFKKVKEAFSEFPKLNAREQLIQKILSGTFPKRKISFFMKPAFAYLTAFTFLIFSYMIIPNKNKILIEINRQLHLAYSKIEKILVKGESFKEYLIGYKENFEEIFKEKKIKL